MNNVNPLQFIASSLTIRSKIGWLNRQMFQASRQCAPFETKDEPPAVEREKVHNTFLEKLLKLDLPIESVKSPYLIKGQVHKVNDSESYVVKDVIADKGLVAWLMIPQEKNSQLQPLIAFRCTEPDIRQRHSIGSIRNDVQHCIGKMGYDANRELFKGWIREVTKRYKTQCMVAGYNKVDQFAFSLHSERIFDPENPRKYRVQVSTDPKHLRRHLDNAKRDPFSNFAERIRKIVGNFLDGLLEFQGHCKFFYREVLSKPIYEFQRTSANVTAFQSKPFIGHAYSVKNF
jgi:hypothetical protein